MPEPLLAVSVRVASVHAEAAVALVLDLAPAGFEERVEGDETILTVYASGAAARGIGRAFPDAVAEPVPPGWEDAWRTFHRPVVVAGVWIGPPWEEPPAGTPAVVIDPGRAFGTGAHATTRLCVELLARTPRGSLLDVGCGSGVLSLAAARLGFAPLAAVDVDPDAVEVARENALVNDVEVTVEIADGASGLLPPADVAVVNILLPAVEAVLPRLAVTTAITSGYLAHERPGVPGWVPVDRVEADGWAADRLVPGDPAASTI